MEPHKLNRMNNRINDLPILMYHAIRSGADDALPQTSSIEHAVEARDFREQLDAIVDGGYRTITLDDLERPASEPKSLLITFDDGHESDLDRGRAQTCVPKSARDLFHRMVLPWTPRLSESRPGACASSRGIRDRLARAYPRATYRDEVRRRRRTRCSNRSGGSKTCSRSQLQASRFHSGITTMPCCRRRGQRAIGES